MSDNSKIQWTDATWNPWHGCKKVSAGCKFCYMFRDKERYGQEPTTVIRSKTKFNDPDKWPDGKLIFTCSWSDWFIEEADAWRDEAWAIIKRNPHHTFQILTKRPERIEDHLPKDWGEGYDNVWLGVSVEDERVIERMAILSEIECKVRFVSLEPLIDGVTLSSATINLKGKGWSENFSVLPAFHWMIVGGESGNETGNYKYRPCYLEWIYDIVEECQKNHIPIFVKQLGTHLAKEMKLKDRHGGDMDEWPQELRVREFPRVKRFS